MNNRLAVFGGGQLGRMLALAAAPLGIRVRVLDPDPDACAGEVAELIVGEFDDPDAIAALLRDVDAVTFEFENVPISTIDEAQKHGLSVRPGATSLRIASDRLLEKNHLASLGIRLAPFAAVDDEASLHAAVAAVGTPAILKSRRGGYDGKGQASVNTPEDAAQAWATIGHRPAVIETRIEFSRECSVIVTRTGAGSIDAYPLIENEHSDGILRTSIAPARCDADRNAEAVRWASDLAESLDHVGVLTLELFETAKGLLANEFAPRVHNSGHWTIEGSQTSQFENHVRAVMDLPLGSTATRAAAVMLNLIGEVPDRASVLGLPNACLHLYSKAPKAGRKLGHITCLASDLHAASEAADLAKPLVLG